MSPVADEKRRLKIEPPLPYDLIEEMIGFWEESFGTPYDEWRGILLGEERESNRDVIYGLWDTGKLLGTSHLTVSCSNPILGGFGEVATRQEGRRRGIASELSAETLKDFRSSGGEALFLGTGNPEAARIYSRLGWKKLAGADVMVNLTRDSRPENFFATYFNAESKITIRPGSAAARIPMIPLLTCPHDWQVLDAVAGMYSTTYVTQSSCMGLYPNYARLTADGKGAWFTAQTDRNRIVGLASARIGGDGGCQVDGFVHEKFDHSWQPLLEASLNWANSQDASYCWTRTSKEDHRKVSHFESIAFSASGESEPFDFSGRPVVTILQDRKVSTLRMKRKL